MNHLNATGKPTLSARAILLIELALAMGGFAIGTGEFAIMGLMPNVAQGLGISEPQVGHVISAYALGVVVGAPLLAILGSRMFRRHLLLLLMTFFALGNFASAMAADYHTLMVFRFIAGLPHGARSTRQGGQPRTGWPDYCDADRQPNRHLAGAMAQLALGLRSGGSHRPADGVAGGNLPAARPQ